MNKNIVVMTMPIKPQDTTNIGMYIAPTIMNVLSDILKCKSVFSINLLNSYKDKDCCLQTYINDVSRQGISYNELFIDKNNADILIMLIEQLFFNGYIKEKKRTVLRCDCGKVDIISKGVTENDFAKSYYYKDNKMYCKHCNCECSEYNEMVLILELDEKVDDSIKIVPNFLSKDANHLSKVFRGGEHLISKSRDTGYFINVNDRKYNIDIDFIWTNYFRLFSEEQKILIASNHQVYQMYIMNYLSRILGENNLYFVANPYVYNGNVNNPIEEYEKTLDSIYKKLFILYNLKWKKKDCEWSTSVIDYLSNISNTRRLNLYKTITSCLETQIGLPQEIDKVIETILFNDINMQRNIVDSKKYAIRR